jgi:hypothetical protein
MPGAILPPIQAGSPFNEDFLKRHHITAVVTDGLFLADIRQEIVRKTQGDSNTLGCVWIKLSVTVK